MRKRTASGDSQCEELFVCEDISINSTSSLTPSCPIVTPTKCSSFTTDASTNSINTSTTVQQEIQKTKDGLLVISVAIESFIYRGVGRGEFEGVRAKPLLAG